MGALTAPDTRVSQAAPPQPPWALLAELTHACPLHCVYCSNPVELTRRATELTTRQWSDVLRQAAALGVVQCHLSGGEPLLRADLEEIVHAAESAGIYTQLVTSGVGLTADRLRRLTEAGLRSAQLSVQHADARRSRLIAGTDTFTEKENAARLIRAAGLPLGLNVVLHRHNLDALDDLVALGREWKADRIELANAQYYGWALRNRAALLPSRDQLRRARASFETWRKRLAGEMALVWVIADYFEGEPKPCMGGWGAVSLTVAPDGTVLPCPSAGVIPDLDPPRVPERSLRWIWERSSAFNRFRGTDWMPDLCRGCARKEIDFGGCRCQAQALTGDSAATDPACSLSPDHHLMGTATSAVDMSDATSAVYRTPGRQRTVTLPPHR